MKLTAQQRANIEDALCNMLPSIPPKNIAPHLNVWRKDDPRETDAPATCGTIACFGGWCAIWPNFRAQGVIAGNGGEPMMPDRNWYASGTARFLFGDPELFNSRSQHEADGYFTGTDHGLISHRLRYVLAHAE